VNREELYELIDKYLAGEANEEEKDLLSRYYNSFQQNTHWDELKLGSESEMKLKLFQRIQENIISNTTVEVTEVIDEPQVIKDAGVFELKEKGRVSTFIRIVAAACIIGLLVLSGFLLFRGKQKTEVAQTNSNNKYYKNDIAPGSDKAILKLADGSTIVLDDARNGAVAQQGNTKVIKLNGKLDYNASASENEVLYNTISTPRGGKYQIELVDGTQVWLNAASSLRFPTAFNGKERKVEITGEAYFEVARNKDMPFIVSANGAEVQVLGTHFNVMAYNEEASLKTTLIEGSVRFVSNDVASILKPGQQSQFLKNGQVKVVSNVDLEEVLAWKNGVFHFEAADIEIVMRQLSRWYDVEVIYNKQVDEQFYAQIPRNTKLSDVLKALEMTGKVHFKIEGRKIVVMP
jgi:transmembrane sensor